jgi:GNAT superfamily N-acetyltransferase
MNPRRNPRRSNPAHEDEDGDVPDCAWCGAPCDQPRPYLNRRGEPFCSPTHRAASNRALARFMGEEATRKPRRSNPETGAFSHAEGAQGTGEEIVGTLDGEPVGGIIVFSSALDLNNTLRREEFARFRGLPRGQLLGWLGAIDLPESSRNKGYGAAIVTAMLDEARSRGVGAVVLHADSAASQRFWARMGFEEQEIQPEDARRGVWMTPMLRKI